MGDKLAGSTIVVGGDGRYYGKEATEKIIRMCAANKVCSVKTVVEPFVMLCRIVFLQQQNLNYCAHV